MRGCPWEVLRVLSSEELRPVTGAGPGASDICIWEAGLSVLKDI